MRNFSKGVDLNMTSRLSRQHQLRQKIEKAFMKELLFFAVPLFLINDNFIKKLFMFIAFFQERHEELEKGFLLHLARASSPLSAVFSAIIIILICFLLLSHFSDSAKRKISISISISNLPLMIQVCHSFVAEVSRNVHGKTVRRISVFRLLAGAVKV